MLNKDMKLGVVFSLVFIYCSSCLGQTLSIVRSSDTKGGGNDFLGKHRSFILRLVNDSNQSISVLGNHEDGDYDPENDIQFFDPEKKKWQFTFGGETSDIMQSVKDDSSFFALSPGSSFKFEILLTYSCKPTRHKIVLFYKLGASGVVKKLDSEEILLKPREGCLSQ